jgi:hypothetical protein
MTCPGCAHALDPHGHPHGYYFGCRGCDARSLLRYDEVKEALRLKEMTPAYRNALNKFFGKDWEAGHKLVKEWNAKLTTREATP